MNLVRHRQPAESKTATPQRSEGAVPEHSLPLGLSDASQIVDGGGPIKTRIFEREAGQGEGLEARLGDAETVYPLCQWVRANGSDTCWRRALFVGHMFCRFLSLLLLSPPPALRTAPSPSFPRDSVGIYALSVSWVATWGTVKAAWLQRRCGECVKQRSNSALCDHTWECSTISPCRARAHLCSGMPQARVAREMPPRDVPFTVRRACSQQSRDAHTCPPRCSKVEMESRDKAPAVGALQPTARQCTHTRSRGAWWCRSSVPFTVLHPIAGELRRESALPSGRQVVRFRELGCLVLCTQASYLHASVDSC